ncbi:hypothetical protein DESUT3_17780 [Desulfuromonas versatilis]|uniref:Uncharacterized protein n=1 Tax=Desulfuromonas versatilis TaxID=2802975 RepID=A0ABM8HRY9_9BACT|nr:hypothetical protein DESUT3_17780 [Desulfuromonas versatilis]
MPEAAAGTVMELPVTMKITVMAPVMALQFVEMAVESAEVPAVMPVEVVMSPSVMAKMPVEMPLAPVAIPRVPAPVTPGEPKQRQGISSKIPRIEHLRGVDIPEAKANLAGGDRRRQQQNSAD